MSRPDKPVPSDFRIWTRRLGLKVGPAVRRAAAYLEAQGQRFMVHFGTDNAVDKAREHWLGRRQRKGARHV